MIKFQVHQLCTPIADQKHIETRLSICTSSGAVQNKLAHLPKKMQSKSTLGIRAKNGEIRPLVTDQLNEFEKQLVQLKTSGQSPMILKESMEQTLN